MNTQPQRPNIQVGDSTLGGGTMFALAGPCVLESLELALSIAEEVKEVCSALAIPLVFKASFDKANRTSAGAGRGPGFERGLEWLNEVRERVGVNVVTDVHLPEHCAQAAEVVDILQIPAFLCRQTDLLVAAAETGCAVNVKKGQFLPPWDAKHVVGKVTGAGNPNVLITERGSSFGYGRLVVDMAGFRDLAETGCPVVFDATHSVQRPGGADGTTGGDRTLAPMLARSAAATGFVDGFFFETHPDPDTSPSDGANMIRLEDFADVLSGVQRAHSTATESLINCD
jgi:2-dehydro-3-deoxyphosphooctonate aldolase (KDO 8-P synthase)